MATTVYHPTLPRSVLSSQRTRPGQLLVLLELFTRRASVCDQLQRQHQKPSSTTTALAPHQPRAFSATTTLTRHRFLSQTSPSGKKQVVDEMTVLSSSFEIERISPTITLVFPGPAAAAAAVKASPSSATEAATATSIPDPKLIILFPWMAAQEPHIKKYIQGHQALFPTSPVLVIRCPLSHMLSTARGKREVGKAIGAVGRYVDVPYTTTHNGNEKENGDGEGEGEGAAAEEGTEKPLLLFHALSNGGSTSLSHLLSHLTHAAPLTSSSSSTSSLSSSSSSSSPPVTTTMMSTATIQALPPHATIFDSAPGTFTWRGSYAAMSAGLPRSFLARLAAFPLLHTLIAMYFVDFFVVRPWLWKLCRFFGFFQQAPACPTAVTTTTTTPPARPRPRAVPTSESLFHISGALSGPPPSDPLTHLFSSHLHPSRIGAETGGRTYIYGPADAMVSHHDVETHAARATQLGFPSVNTERFEGSPHVAHMKMDGERYWGAVGKRWGWAWGQGGVIPRNDCDDDDDDGA